MPNDGPQSIFRPFDGMPDQPKVRLPPSNIPAETAFLGALLANNKVADRAQFLRCEHFADPVNGRIYQEAMRLIEDSRIADAVTLKSVFEQSGVLDEVGGTAYLTSLLRAMVGIVNAGDYARIVRDKWVCRELIDIGEIMVNSAFGDDQAVDPVKVAMDAVAMIDQVSAGVIKNKTTSLNTAIGAAMDAMRRAKGKPAGVSTGFTCLDARLGGLEPGLVYTLAGRPGAGKSALGHQIALNVARRRIPVLELSLEMSAIQLGRRSLSAESGVPLFVMKSGQYNDYDEDRLKRAELSLKDLPLMIDDSGGLSPRQIASRCREAKRKHGSLGLVMLDHLNLTKPDDNDEKHGPTYAIGRAAGTMLEIAKDCEVPVLMLTQLNRGVEGRDDKRPGLADLRQSGAIEENSYAVGFVYREEYYSQNGPEQKEGEEKTKFEGRYTKWVLHRNKIAGKAEVIWGKVRDGEPGTDHLRFDGKTTSFSEPAFLGVMPDEQN